MSKSRDAFRTISEVAELLDTPAHVLRFWETKFSQVKPVKRAGGRRYYRPNDVALLAGIRQLLHDDGLTIKGVQKVLREQGVKHVAGIAPPPELLDEVSDVAAVPAVAPAAIPEPQEGATVLPFTQSGTAPTGAPAATEEPVDAALDAVEEFDEPSASPAEEPAHAATTPLSPASDDPAPHAPLQGALWHEESEAEDTAAVGVNAPEEPTVSDAEAEDSLPDFITESFEERGTEPLSTALPIPALPDLAALPAPAPGPLASLPNQSWIDAHRAAALAPHVAALRAFVAARQAGRFT